MKTLTKTLVTLGVPAILVTSTLATAALPPVQPSKTKVGIINNAPQDLKWRYHETYGACDSSPEEGVVTAAGGTSNTLVTCAYTAAGEFDFVNTEGVLIGQTAVRYGGWCGPAHSSDSNYNINASIQNKECEITITGNKNK